MSLAVIKPFLARVWSFVKHYWYIPLVALVAMAFFIISRDKKIVDWGRVLQEANDAHKAEIDVIQKTQEQQRAADALALKRMQDAEEQVRSKYASDMKTLDSKKEKRIKSIIKQFKDDPHVLQAEIEKETGYRVAIIQ